MIKRQIEISSNLEAFLEYLNCMSSFGELWSDIYFIRKFCRRQDSLRQIVLLLLLRLGIVRKFIYDTINTYNTKLTEDNKNWN